MKRFAAFVLVIVMALASCGCVEDTVTKIFGYQITFDPNGGTVDGGELVQLVKRGEDAVPPTLHRDGYELLGFKGEYTSVKETATVTAEWRKLWSVSFDPNGGSIEGGEMKVADGATPNPPVPEREGWKFDGWEPSIAPATADAVYHAKWSRISYTATEVNERISPAVIEIVVRDERGVEFALGSGFFIDDHGTAVTNYHVMEGAYSAYATMSDGSKADVVGVIDYSQELDLAIITVAYVCEDYLIVSDEGVSTGQTVYAIGSSLGLTGTFSNGIVSTASRMIDGVDYIQVTAPISHGNSGGPLVNEYCEVVGVNTLTTTEGQNLNFAVNIKELGKLNTDGFITMEEFGELTAVEPGFYSVFSSSEVEPNNTKGSADSLIPGVARAAEISSYSDEDYYYIRVTDECDVAVYFEFYSDGDGISYGFFVLNGNDLEYLEDVEFNYDSSSDLFVAYLHAEPGDYFLCISAPEDSSQVYPIYYAIMTEVRY